MTRTKDRLHLLIFIYSMGDGGAERVTANLANYWAAKGWKISIVTLASINSDLLELHPSINRISLEMANESANALAGIIQNIRRILTLRKLLRKVQPDITLGKMTTANILLALASWGLPNACAIGAEHNYPGRGSLGYLWQTIRKHTYGLLHAVIALTSESEHWLKQNTNAKRVLVIPNAVSWPLSGEEPQNVQSVYIRPERRRLLAVGRFVEIKRFDILIEAFSGLANKHTDWDLVIVGDGPLRDTLEKQIRRFNLSNRIFLPGRSSNMGEWYKNSDLYALSSRSEGFPMTLIEAMSYGLTAVSFDCDTGPRDIILHEIDGLLVPPGNLNELSIALDRLMGDDLLRQQFSARALEVRERFSMTSIANMWEKLFEELLNGQK
jgi:glycosyltransferase involved in cell wall biosynthesis